MTTDVLDRRDTHLRLGCRSSQYVDRGVIGQCQLMSTQAKLYGQQDTTMNVYWSTVPGRVSGTEFASQRLLGHGKSPESRRWRRGVRHLIQPSWPRAISRKPYIIFEGSPVATTSPEAWSFANARRHTQCPASKFSLSTRPQRIIGSFNPGRAPCVVFAYHAVATAAQDRASWNSRPAGNGRCHLLESPSDTKHQTRATSGAFGKVRILRKVCRRDRWGLVIHNVSTVVCGHFWFRILVETSTSNAYGAQNASYNGVEKVRFSTRIWSWKVDTALGYFRCASLRFFTHRSVEAAAEEPEAAYR